MAEEPPFHVVSNRDVWNSLQTLTTLVQKLDSKFDVQNAQIAEHDKDIRNLNMKFYGVLAGLIASLTAVGITII